MLERQAKQQKRVKFDDGREHTVYMSGDDSDDGRAGAFSKVDYRDLDGGQDGAGDLGQNIRRGPGNYEEYVEVSRISM